MLNGQVFFPLNLGLIFLLQYFYFTCNFYLPKILVTPTLTDFVSFQPLLIHWGLCVPKECDTDSVIQILDNLFEGWFCKMVLNKDLCYKREHPSYFRH